MSYPENSGPYDPCSQCKKTKCTNKNIRINGKLDVKCNTTLSNVTVTGKMERVYDYIIVGFGTTSSVIARKLLDNGKSVLILERGKNNIQVGNIKSATISAPVTFAAPTKEVPYVNVELTADLPWGVSTNDYKMNKTPAGAQRFKPGYAEGNGWGGGGSHYYMNAYRGSDYVWNDFDSVVGNSNKWNYSAVLPLLKGVEKYTQRSDNPGLIQPDRGTSGAFSIVQMDDWTKIQSDPTLIKFATAPTVGLGWSSDLNSSNGKNPVGVSFKQVANELPLNPSYGGTTRSSSINEMMKIGEVIDENGRGIGDFDVIVKSNVIVNRVLFDGTKAVGVEYLRDFEKYAISTATSSPLTFPLSNATINVVDTSAFPATGRLTIAGFYSCSYTAKTATAFTGCTSNSGQAGVISSGAQIAIGLTTTSGSISLIRPFNDLLPSDFDRAYGKTIILCSGGQNTPLILQRSGVGDATLLTSLGIPVVVANSNVGQNLASHYNMAGFSIGPASGGPSSVQIAVPSGTSAMGFNLHGLGPVGDTYYYPDDNVRRFQVISLNPATITGRPSPNLTDFTLATNMYKPKSRGYTKITSKNPLAAPDCDLNLLSDAGSLTVPPQNDSDMNRCVAYLKVIRQIVASSGTMQIYGNLASVPNTDQGYVDFVKNNINVQNHTCGTCTMGTSILNGVVDADLKVFGTNNLYCADMSVLPFGPDGNPNESLRVVGLRLIQALGFSPLPDI